MVNEARSFGLAVALALVGLAVLLYGVTLNNGEELNAVIATGGVIVVVGLAILTVGVVRIDTRHAE
jgi:hypothetical protein